MSTKYNPVDYMDRWAIERKSSGHFFDPSSMRFFNSRIAQVGYVGTSRRRVYFVTSEKFDDSTPRRYTVRAMDLDSGNILRDVGEFQQYASSKSADNAARRAAVEDTDPENRAY